MAVQMHAPKGPNYWAWGGGAIAAIVLILAVSYGFGWLGLGGSEAADPVIEQSSTIAE